MRRAATFESFNPEPAATPATVRPNFSVRIQSRQLAHCRDRKSSIQVSADGTKVYVTNFLNHTFSVLNTATNTVTVTVALPGTSFPAVAISPDGNTLFVANNLGDNLGIVEDLRGTRRLVRFRAVGAFV